MFYLGNVGCISKSQFQHNKGPQKIIQFQKALSNDDNEDDDDAEDDKDKVVEWTT